MGGTHNPVASQARWRQSPWLAVGEVALVAAVIVADRHHLVPLSTLAVPIVAHGVSNTLAFVLIYFDRYPGV